MGNDTVLTNYLGCAQVGGAASGVQRYSAFGEVRSRSGGNFCRGRGEYWTKTHLSGKIQCCNR